MKESKLGTLLYPPLCDSEQIGNGTLSLFKADHKHLNSIASSPLSPQKQVW